MSKLQLLAGRPLYYSFVFLSGLLIFGGWYCVSLYVQWGTAARLESQFQNIESHTRERLHAFADGLTYARSLFFTHGVPTRDGFRRFVEGIEPGKRITGLRSIGYADARRNDRGELGSRITLLEPLTERNRRMLGIDMMTEENRRAAMMRALETGEVTLSPAVQPFGIMTPSPGFLLYLPLFEPGTRPGGENVGPRPRAVRGFLFAVLNAEEYFGSVFGKPDLASETVNFEVLSEDHQGNDRPLYSRFGSIPPARAGLVRDQAIDIYGHRWRLRVTPLPQFYTWSDRYLPLFAGVVGFLFFVLATLLLRALQNKLLLEIEARARIEADGRRLLRLSSRLEKINDAGRDLISIDPGDRWAEIFLKAALEIAGADRGFFYLESTADGQSALRLAQTSGFRLDQKPPATLPSENLASLFRGRTALTPAQLEAEPPIALSAPPGWRDESGAFFRLSKRPVGTAGLLYLARRNGDLFDEDADQLIETLVTHAATILEMKSHLRRAEDSNMAKSAFLANMSHEIRTPLNAILGFSSLLAQEDDMDADERTRTVNLVRKNGDQLTRIIDDILDLSKVEAGRMVMQESWVSLPRLLREIRIDMGLRAKLKNLSFDIRLDSAIPAEILTDGVRLKQILMNVVGNAVKFTEKGAVEVALSFDRETVSGATLTVTVTDTGVGIPASMTKHLFKPFLQADDSYTRRHGGTGLGLALSKKLAGQLHGDLNLVETSPRGGSVFRLQLDIASRFRGPLLEHLPGENAEPAPARDVLPRLDNRRLLLVEDSPDNQDIFRHYLETAGAAVHIADNGRKAIEEALARPYDLVLMDIQLPEVDGLVATRTLRSRGFEKPILALTAHALHEEKTASLRAGCNGHLIKPITAFDLATAVYNTLKEPHSAKASYDHN